MARLLRMKWEPVDWIVLLLAVIIFIAFTFAAITPILLGEPISDARTKVFGGIATSVVAVISVYVGAKINRARKEDEEDED